MVRPWRRARIQRWVAAAALLSLTAAFAWPGAANPHGIVGVTETGCTCHAAAPSPDVRPLLSGLPNPYAPGRTYTLTVSVEGGPPVDLDRGGHAGGFDLRVSAGTLRIPAGSETVLKSEEGASLHDMTGGGHGNVPFAEETWGELTFTHLGANDRQWDADWRAPAPGAGNVSFQLAVLSANGDHANSDLDAWNRTVFVTGEDPPVPGGGANLWWWALGLTAALSGGGYLVARRRGQSGAAGRRSSKAHLASPMTRCPDCGVDVRTAHLSSHRTKVHQ